MNSELLYVCLYVWWLKCIWTAARDHRKTRLSALKFMEKYVYDIFSHTFFSLVRILFLSFIISQQISPFPCWTHTKIEIKYPKKWIKFGCNLMKELLFHWNGERKLSFKTILSLGIFITLYWEDEGEGWASIWLRKLKWFKNYVWSAIRNVVYTLCYSSHSLNATQRWQTFMSIWIVNYIVECTSNCLNFIAILLNCQLHMWEAYARYECMCVCVYLVVMLPKS